MSRRILLNPTQAQRWANSLDMVAGQFENRTLSSIDQRSTITANESAQISYNFAQSSQNMFGRLLRRAAGNILALAGSFSEIDTRQAANFRINKGSM